MTNKTLGLFLLIYFIAVTVADAGIRIMDEEEVIEIAQGYIGCMNLESDYAESEIKVVINPYSISFGLDSFLVLACNEDMASDGVVVAWHKYLSATNLPYAIDNVGEPCSVFRRSEMFLLKRKEAQPTLFFSHATYRQDSNETWQVSYDTKRVDFDEQGRPYGVRLPDGGLSLFRSPDFVSIDVCDPWILKGTNAIVEKAAVIPALTNRVIACSDKPGAVATYRDARAMSGTNVTGAVLAVFFDVNRDGDCDAYLTDGARSIGGGTNEWSLVLHGTNGWTLAESDFVSTNEVATGEDRPLFAGGRPYTSPRTLVAATNDFFAVSKLMWWHSSEYLEIGAPEIEVSDPRGLNKLEKLPCETFDSP